MHNVNKVAIFAFSVVSFLACQSESKMGGSSEKAREKKPLVKKQQVECLDLLNASDASAPPQLVTLSQYTFGSDADFKAGKRAWWGWNGIIIGPNAILSVETSWPDDLNPGPIKIQLASDQDKTYEHLALLPEVETVIHHPSVAVKSVTPLATSTLSGPSVDQGVAKAGPEQSNEWDRVSKTVVVLKSRLATLPKYFRVSGKRRLPGDQVTLIGMGARNDMDSDTLANIGTAIGTNTLLDSAGLPQEFSWVKNDATYLIGGRRITDLNTATTDSMPAHGDGGSAMVQGNTLVGMALTINRQEMNGLLGKESLAVYLDLSSKFAQELISAAIEKKAEIVKENDKRETQTCKKPKKT